MSSSYKSIFRATGIIGLSQIVIILFGIIRNKVVAVILGTSGFGIFGLYNNFINMLTSFSTLGLDKSGVKQISQKNDDPISFAECIWTFKTSILFISSISLVVTILFSCTLSEIIFNTKDKYIGIIIISIVILLSSITNGQNSILNGIRDLKGLAKGQIIGSILGSFFSISFILVLGEDGIPFSILSFALTAVLVTYFFVRKHKIKSVIPSISIFWIEFKIMFKLGLGFSIAGLFATIMLFLSQIYLNSEFNLQTVGIYQASWTISNVYINTILVAMGVDFLPRIAQVIQDKASTTKLINEQIEFGVLISSIGISGILLFSPLVLNIFYSSAFTSGVSIIRWQILGVALRVLGFPFSYAIIARNKPFLYILTHVVVFSLDYLFLIILTKNFGFLGLGVNYFLSYIIYILILLFISKKIFDFKFSRLSIKIFTVSWILIITSWLVVLFFDNFYSIFFGIILLSINVIWILRVLRYKMNISILSYVKSKFIR